MRRAGATLHRGARASHCRGLSCCGAQAPDAQAQQLWLTGPVAPRHVGSSQTRARTRVPCIGRQILNHCATREAPIYCLDLVSWAPAWLLQVPLTHVRLLPSLPVLPAVLSCKILSSASLDPFLLQDPDQIITTSTKCSQPSPSSDLFAATPRLLQRPLALFPLVLLFGPCTNSLPWILISLKAGALSIPFCFPVVACAWHIVFVQCMSDE